MVTLHLTHSDLHLASRASAAGLIGRRGNPGLICVTAASHLRPPQVPQLHPLRPGFAFNYFPSRVKMQQKITINHKRMNSLWSPDCINTKHTELFGPSSTWFELCRSHIAHCFFFSLLSAVSPLHLTSLQSAGASPMFKKLPCYSLMAPADWLNPLQCHTERKCSVVLRGGFITGVRNRYWNMIMKWAVIYHNLKSPVFCGNFQEKRNQKCNLEGKINPKMWNFTLKKQILNVFLYNDWAM